MANLCDHIEQYLGEIQQGWTTSFQTGPCQLQIVECYGGELKGWTTYCTLGLSNLSLKATGGDLLILHEIFMVAPKGEEPENIPALLVDLAEEAIKAGYAFVRGDVIGPRGTLFEGYEFTALYVSLPFCLSDSFAVVELEPGANVRFAWLVPISSAEAEFVKSHGWNRFEEIMETKEVDVLPLERASVF